MTSHAVAGHALRADAEPASLAAKGGPIVVKLGGSVIRSPDLSSWLDAIAASRVPIVVVPGGGALADEVRDCQAKLGFGDRAPPTAWLSLAMDQLAWAVAGLRGGFQVGATEAELCWRARAWPGRRLGALCSDRRADRYRGELADHLRQPRALACWPARRKTLLSDQVHHSAKAEPGWRRAACPRRRGRCGLSLDAERGPRAELPARPRRSGGLRRRSLRHRTMRRRDRLRPLALRSE